MQAEELAEFVERVTAMRDPYESGHSKRVAEYAVDLAQALGLTTEQTASIRRGGLLHDIGKLAIREDVLNKTGKLAKAEMYMVQRHATLGLNLIYDYRFGEDVEKAILHHHEDWDGGGYPDGLSGEAIPLPARILRIADAYEALTSARPYRGALSATEAIENMRLGAGRKYDARLFSVFEELVVQEATI